MLGSHLSIAGSMTIALTTARELGLDTVQVFTKNQQQWSVPPLGPAVTRDWLEGLKALGWNTGVTWHGQDYGRVVAHASYLINLASPSEELWEKSVRLMRVEIERCAALGIPWLVHHPGSPTGTPAREGMERIARAYDRLFKETGGARVVSCLENTVGSGSTLGGRFEELAELRARIVEATGEHGRVGFCFDTCHAHAAGYDMRRVDAARGVLELFDRICGLEHLAVVHLNDSKAAVGSRRDLHEHIGLGTIGGGSGEARALKSSGFAAVMEHARLAGLPKILETPKGDSPDGTPYDTLNLQRLRKLLPAGKPIKSVPRRRPIGRSRGDE